MYEKIQGANKIQKIMKDWHTPSDEYSEIHIYHSRFWNVAKTIDNNIGSTISQDKELRDIVLDAINALGLMDKYKHVA